MAEYTYGKDFAIRIETDFDTCSGKITVANIKTNADRIRSMSDEELATWLRDWTIKVMEDTETEFILDGSFVKDAIKWLKKEVDDGIHT